MNNHMIEDIANRLFSKEVNAKLIESVETGSYPADLWKKITDSGLQKTLTSELHDGSNLSWIEVFPILFSIGYYQVPIPLAESMIGQFFASVNNINIPSDSIISIATNNQNKNLIIQKIDNKSYINGSIFAVKWGRFADWLLIETNDQIYFIKTTESNIKITQSTDPSGMPSDHVEFFRTPIAYEFKNKINSLPHPVHTLQAVTLSAMMTGALEFILDLSVQYSKDRIQFGKPIAKNQAIQQQLAELAGDVACSYTATSRALQDLPNLSFLNSDSTLFSAAVAKIVTSDASTKGASIAHQVHGAIGFTKEYQLNFATRRLWTWRTEGGSSSEWAENLGKSFISAGSSGFWSNLTSRTLPSFDSLDI